MAKLHVSTSRGSPILLGDAPGWDRKRHNIYEDLLGIRFVVNLSQMAFSRFAEDHDNHLGLVSSHHEHYKVKHFYKSFIEQLSFDAIY